MVAFIKSLFTHRPEEWAFAARAWCLAPLIEAMLATRGLKETLQWVERKFPHQQLRRARPTVVTVEEGAGLIGAVYRRHLVRGRCLPRALLQYALHRRDGVEARLMVGVKKPDGDLAAHAWIETAGSMPSDEYTAVLSRGAHRP